MSEIIEFVEKLRRKQTAEKFIELCELAETRAQDVIDNPLPYLREASKKIKQYHDFYDSIMDAMYGGQIAIDDSNVPVLESMESIQYKMLSKIEKALIELRQKRV